MRHLTQLNDSIWLTLSSNGLQTFTTTSTLFAPVGLVSDPLRVVFSPSGSHVALAMAWSPAGRVPVLNPATGDTAYTLSLQNAEGVAFSGQSDRLFVGSVAPGTGSPDSLVAVSATSGARLAQTALPPGFTGATLATDPAYERVYQVADSSGTLALFVYDGTTLARVGRLGCDARCGNANYWSAGLAIDEGAGLIHVAYPGSPIPVVTFDRLP
jgi:DNA-binding beta-propeller fold protein YncE